MEESSEKRRERLRAMREEASLAGVDGGGGPSVANPPDAPGLPLLSDLQQPPRSPSSRFEFYTDPLAAFSGSQRKKKSRNSFGSPFGGAPPPDFPASPLRQPNFTPVNPTGTSFSSPPVNPTGTSFSSPLAPFPSFNRTPSSNPNPNVTPPGSFSPSNPGSNHQPTALCKPHSEMATMHGHFNPSTNSYHYPNPNHNSIQRGNFYPNSSPPGSFSTLNSFRHSNPGSSAYGPRSAPYNHNGAIYTNSPAPGGGRGSFSAESSQQHGGGMEKKNVQSHGSNRTWGSFKQSAGSGSRGTPGRSGGRGFQRHHGEMATPESFAKRSMLEDPWRDLVPVRIESLAFRLDSCPVSSRDWLPKSVSRVATSPMTQGVSVSASGPSLAESLAASFADAVSGDDGA